jgi:Tfp pilus assembly protein PilF
MVAMATLAVAIISALAWAFTPSSSSRRSKSPAEDLYLRGVYNWEKRTPESLNRAVDFFTQAIVRDPSYARAYAGLANCYNLLREFSQMPEKEAYPRALAATQKALELDDRLADAHASLAFISFWWNWNAAVAEREFQRAISLDPNDVTSHHWYATFLHARGRQREALEQIDEAQRLQPASSSVLADKGLILYFDGQTAAAFALLNQLATEDSTLKSIPRYLALLYLYQSDYPHYLVELKRAADLAQDPGSRAVAQAAERGFNAGGDAGMLQSILSAQMELHKQGLLPSYTLAETAAIAGRNSEAIRYLNAASEESFSSFVVYRIDPAFRNLRSDPAYRELDAKFESGISTGSLTPRHQ